MCSIPYKSEKCKGFSGKTPAKWGENRKIAASRRSQLVDKSPGACSLSSSQGELEGAKPASNRIKCRAKPCYARRAWSEANIFVPLCGTKITALFQAVEKSRRLFRQPESGVTPLFLSAQGSGSAGTPPDLPAPPWHPPACSTDRSRSAPRRSTPRSAPPRTAPRPGSSAAGSWR